MEITVTLTVNGEKQTITTDDRRPLLDILREDLDLTGTKYGCGESQCGSCTVLLDGMSVRSCSTPADQLDGKNIVTIEGLSSGEMLHPVQEAFLVEGAVQCGYCIPGMIMSAVALFEADSSPSEGAIRAWMNGNVCRCTGYTKILNALRRAAGHDVGDVSS